MPGAARDPRPIESAEGPAHLDGGLLRAVETGQLLISRASPSRMPSPESRACASHNMTSDDKIHRMCDFIPCTHRACGGCGLVYPLING